MRFKSVIRQKKGCSTVLTDTCNQKTINRNFEENLVLFECMKCCYLISFKKCSTVFTDTCIWKKLQNLTKRYFSLISMRYSFSRSFNSFKSSAYMRSNCTVFNLVYASPKSLLSCFSASSLSKISALECCSFLNAIALERL